MTASPTAGNADIRWHQRFAHFVQALDAGRVSDAYLPLFVALQERLHERIEAERRG